MGQAVTVKYLPGDPANASVVKPFPILTMLFLIVVGLVFATFGVGALVGARKGSSASR
jgi:hypothetical protein